VQSCLSLLMQLAVLAPAETGTVSTSTPSVRADEAASYRVAPDETTDPGVVVLRGLFFVPRMVTTIAFLPIRGALWVFEEFDLADRYVDLFYNDERTFGIFPTIFAETGFGVGAGAKLVARDLLADDTQLSLSAGYGGRFRQFYRGEVSTGELISDWLVLGIEGGYQERPRDYHFGVGATSPDDEVRIQRRRVQGLAYARFEPADFLRITASGLFSDWKIEHGPDDPGADLTVFGPEYQLAYQEVFVEIDTRKPAHATIVDATPSSGVYLAGSGGITEVISTPTSQYGRWTADAQWLIDLFHGNRVLALRGYAESVTGRLDEIPLLELPSLGGPYLLRGYERYRFRDRALTVVSAEYRFPIISHAAGYIFVDGGRVFRSLEEFSFKDWRMGFGGGFDLYSREEQLIRLQAAGSKDGDFQLSVVFGADFDSEPRSDR
jgi:hypothetical protein